jgi:maltose-binding protein MalE
MIRPSQRRRALISLAIGAVLALAAIPASAQEKKLSVWWVKGFYKSEDDALYEAIRKFAAKTGIKVDLSQYPVQDMIPKTVAALDAGTPPDVTFADVYDFQVAGKWAFDGKLEDLSAILEPMKQRFAPNTLETTLLYNDKTKNRAYYAFPLKQQTMHIEYWIDKNAEMPETSMRQALFVDSQQSRSTRVAPHSWSRSLTASARRASIQAARSARWTPFAAFCVPASIRTSGSAISPALILRTNLSGVRWLK